MTKTNNFFRKMKRIILLFSFVFIYQVASAQGVASDDWTKKIQLYGHGFSVPTDFTDAEYEFIANTYKIFTVEKRHAYNTYGGSPSTERSTIGTAAKLKAINPDIKVLLYWNSVMSYDGLYESNAEFIAHPEWVHSVWPTGYDIYDLDNIDCQDWWVNSIVKIIEDGDLDGVFLDAGPKVDVSGLIDGYNTAVDRVRDSIGTDKIVVYNGYRVASSTSMQAGPELIAHQSGVYIEFFLYPPLDTKEEAALLYDNLADAYNNGKTIIPRGGATSYLPGTAAADRFQFSFASFLLFYGPNSYYIYNEGYKVSEGMLDYYPEFYDLATGASLGGPQRNGWVYTREFENYTITVDLENLTSSIEAKSTSIVPVTGVSVDPSSATLTSVGATQSLSATVSPTDATNKEISWSTSNTKVATVSANGVVTSVANGNATIIATTDDGGFIDSCIITSLGEIALATEFHIISNKGLSLYAGDDSRAAGDPLTLVDLVQGDASMIWVESLRPDGFYTYQLKNTNYCIDGGDGGANSQTVTVSYLDSEDVNQHWTKESISEGVYRLIKRDVEFGMISGDTVNLWRSPSTALNMHWTFIDATGAASGINEDAAQGVSIYPNPASDFLMIETEKDMSRVDVYSIQGQLLLSQQAYGTSFKLSLPVAYKSLLFVNVVLKEGGEVIEKIIVE